MKQFIYILLVLIFVSCSSRETKNNYEYNSTTENVEDYYRNSSSTNKYLTITTQKLHDYSDLLKLEKQHPELKADIIEQLQSLSKTKIVTIDPKYTIENIQQVGETETLSDSVQKIKLKYSLISRTEIKEDSITTYIKTTTILLDGRNNIANKVTFSKN